MKTRYTAQHTGQISKTGYHFGIRGQWRERRSTLSALFVVIVVLVFQNYSEPAAARAETLVQAVGAIGMTVSDLDRSIDFYQNVLSFRIVSDVEAHGAAYEHLQGLFGLRMRVVRMQLGGEFIELIEYMTPQGRPIPVDSRSNDHWFQHIAIIVSDMDKA